MGLPRFHRIYENSQSLHLRKHILNDLKNDITGFRDVELLEDWVTDERRHELAF